MNNKKEAIEHYLNYGIHENRIYKRETNTILYELFSNRKIKKKDDLFLILNEIIKNNITKIDDFIKPKKNIYNNHKLVFPNINYNEFKIEEDLSLYSSFNEKKKLSKTQIFFDCKLSNFSNIYDSFFVILDLPEDFYGGSKFFINSIIEQYKNKQNFLILRPSKIGLIN